VCVCVCVCVYIAFLVPLKYVKSVRITKVKSLTFLRILKNSPDENSWLKKEDMSKKQGIYGSPACKEICKESNLCHSSSVFYNTLC